MKEILDQIESKRQILHENLGGPLIIDSLTSLRWKEMIKKTLEVPIFYDALVRINALTLIALESFNRVTNLPEDPWKDLAIAACKKECARQIILSSMHKPAEEIWLQIAQAYGVEIFKESK